MAPYNVPVIADVLIVPHDASVDLAAEDAGSYRFNQGRRDLKFLTTTGLGELVRHGVVPDQSDPKFHPLCFTRLYCKESFPLEGIVVLAPASASALQRAVEGALFAMQLVGVEDVDSLQGVDDQLKAEFEDYMCAPSSAHAFTKRVATEILPSGAAHLILMPDAWQMPVRASDGERVYYNLGLTDEQKEQIRHHVAHGSRVFDHHLLLDAIRAGRFPRELERFERHELTADQVQLYLDAEAEFVPACIPQDSDSDDSSDDATAPGLPFESADAESVSYYTDAGSAIGDNDEPTPIDLLPAAAAMSVSANPRFPDMPDFSVPLSDFRTHQLTLMWGVWPCTDKKDKKGARKSRRPQQPEIPSAIARRLSAEPLQDQYRDAQHFKDVVSNAVLHQLWEESVKGDLAVDAGDWVAGAISSPTGLDRQSAPLCVTVPEDSMSSFNDFEIVCLRHRATGTKVLFQVKQQKWTTFQLVLVRNEFLMQAGGSSGYANGVAIDVMPYSKGVTLATEFAAVQRVDMLSEELLGTVVRSIPTVPVEHTPEEVAAISQAHGLNDTQAKALLNVTSLTAGCAIVQG